MTGKFTPRSTISRMVGGMSEIWAKLTRDPAQTDGWQSLVFRSSLLLSCACLLVLFVLIGWHVYGRNQITKTAQRMAQAKAVEAARQIETELSELPVLAQTIADELTSGKLKDIRVDVEKRLKKELGKYPGISALTACYKPDFIAKDIDSRPVKDRRYCPYAFRSSKYGTGVIEIRKVEDVYDYTKIHVGCVYSDDPLIDCSDPEIRTTWYHRPLAAKGPVWSEPYWGQDIRVWWAGFGIPFYRNHPVTQQREVAGVVSVDITLADFQKLVATVDLGKPGAGYGFILSQTGAFISHPLESFVALQKTITDLDARLTVEKLVRLNALADREIDGGLVVTDVDSQSGRSSWIFFAPVASAGWWVGIALDKDEVFRDGQIIRRLQRERIGIAICIGGFLFFLSLLLFRSYRGTNRGLWAASMSFSCLCVAGIGYLWMLNATPLADDNERNVLLIDQANAAKIVADYAKERSRPTLVPTGIFIQSMEFVDAHNVSITGYIWQKYDKETPAWVKPKPDKHLPGFILPQADVVYKEEIVEAYRKRQGSQDVIGWYFRALLRQEFDVSRYPFDRGDIWIRIWPRNFGREVLLAPDLASYTTTRPTALSGLAQQEFVMEGWDMQRSFFSYRTNHYKTDFGLHRDLHGRLKSRDLYFNIVLRRHFVDAFVSHIIPLAVVAFLLFAALVLTTSREEKMGVLGFNTSAVLAYCAALFFVTIVGQISLRSSLETDGIVYLDYFYFIIYGAILSVSVNTILFTSNLHIPLIQYEDNLVMNLLFWPMLFGLLLIVTLCVFT